jgi:hypothetical protein
MHICDQPTVTASILRKTNKAMQAVNTTKRSIKADCESQRSQISAQNMTEWR